MLVTRAFDPRWQRRMLRRRLAALTGRVPHVWCESLPDAAAASGDEPASVLAARVHALEGRHDRALAVLAALRGQPGEIAYTRGTWVHGLRGEREAALEQLSLAYRQAHPRSMVRALAAYQIAIEAMRSGDLGLARWGAAEVARKAPVPMRPFGLLALGMFEGDEVREGLLRGALAGFEAAGDREGVTMAQSNLGRLHLQLGRHTLARMFLGVSIGAKTRRLDLPGTAIDANNLAVLERRSGRPEQAIPWLRLAYVSNDMLGRHILAAGNLRNLGWALAEAQPCQARAAMHLAAARARSVGASDHADETERDAAELGLAADTCLDLEGISRLLSWAGPDAWWALVREGIAAGVGGVETAPDPAEVGRFLEMTLGGEYAAGEYSSEFGVSPAAAKYHHQRLVRAGVVVMRGSRRGSRYRINPRLLIAA